MHDYKTTLFVQFVFSTLRPHKFVLFSIDWSETHTISLTASRSVLSACNARGTGLTGPLRESLNPLITSECVRDYTKSHFPFSLDAAEVSGFGF